jgi:error-prone DNA polymerase
LLCALLDEQPMGFYPPDALIHEAQRRGIEILPPDVNASEVACTVVDAPGSVVSFPRRPRPPASQTVRSEPPPPAASAAPTPSVASPAPTPPVASPGPTPAVASPTSVTSLHGSTSSPATPLPPHGQAPAPAAPARAAVRLGLSYVLGVRADEVAALVEARSLGAPFRSLDDLAARAGAGAPSLSQLAWSGACDALAAEDSGARSTDPASARAQPRSLRRIALWRLGVAAPAYGVSEGRQLPLPLELPAAPQLESMREWDAMIADYATTGLTIDRHPLRLLREALTARGVVSSADLGELPHEATVHVAGLVVARQRPGTAKGVCFLLLEDETGTVNVIVPPKVYERDRLTVRTEPLVVVEGVLERFASAGGAINVLVRRLAPLDAPDLLEGRPRAKVKDFSMLDDRELARIQAEQPRVAVAAAGGSTAAHVRPAATAARAQPGNGAAARPAPAAAHSSPASASPAGPPAAAHGRPSMAASQICSAATDASGLAAAPASSAVDRLPASDSPAAIGRLWAAASPAAQPSAVAAESSDTDPPEDGSLPAAGQGAEDFRAVAPPIMSFAAGRRR